MKRRHIWMILLTGLVAGIVYNIVVGKSMEKQSEPEEYYEGEYYSYTEIGAAMELEIPENLDQTVLGTAPYADTEQIYQFFDGVGYWEDGEWLRLCTPSAPANYMITVYNLPQDTMVEEIGKTSDGVLIDGGITMWDVIAVRESNPPTVAIEVASEDGAERVSFRIIPLKEGQSYEAFLEDSGLDTAPLQGTSYHSAYHRSEEHGFILYNNLKNKYVLCSNYIEGPMLETYNDRELGALIYWNQGICVGRELQ